jgi:arylsulfatase A-like enzyme
VTAVGAGRAELSPAGADLTPAGGWSAVDTLRLALWLAVVSGTLEGLYRLFQLGVRGQTIGMSPHVIWMAPVANLLWLVVPAILLVVPGRVFGSQRVPRFMLFFLAVLSLVLLYQSMHRAAAALLSAGVAWQVSRWVARSPRFVLMVRRTLPFLILVPILGGGVLAGSRWNHERRMLSSIPPATPDRPNILLIIWDTVRGFNTTIQGYGRPTTPFLERFSREGARFDLAMATAPWTLPSHGSMFTGRRPTELSARLNTPLDDTYPVIAEAFARAGYATGGFTANMSYCSREHGLARGFSHYQDFRLSPTGIIASSRLGIVLLQSDAIRRMFDYYDLPGRKSAAIVNREFLRWVDGGGDRPFFAFLNYFDAHQPYLSPEPYRSRFSFDPRSRFRPRTVDAKFSEMTAEEIRWSMGEYDGGIAYQDAVVDSLMNQLDRRGMLENTIVIITSDHGEHFGEHHRISHGNSLYRQLLQVPLVLRYPRRVPGGTVVSQPVSLADIPQTLFDLAGVTDSAAFPGRSLARYWGGTQRMDSSDVVFSEMPTARGARSYSVTANGYHYIRWFGRPPQLYRLADDAEETRNLADTPEASAVMHLFAALETSFTRQPAKSIR